MLRTHQIAFLVGNPSLKLLKAVVVYAISIQRNADIYVVLNTKFKLVSTLYTTKNHILIVEVLTISARKEKYKHEPTVRMTHA
jgi:hypothetical protein